MRISNRLIVWLKVDWVMPIFAAALVKLRSSATTRNQSRSLKLSRIANSARDAYPALFMGQIDKFKRIRATNSGNRALLSLAAKRPGEDRTGQVFQGKQAAWTFPMTIDW
ncbi:MULTISPECIES: hypothetical protein [unclassified Shinella]|uniref:hypothetical protein n=1 Tax=unclassified Shinella TaxID=2643062 RepID=UPI00234E76D5|nr:MULTISPECIES: hypothetical protein [unclassified Shinella]MCO5148451.1 hypothetical protein [Shinella sp.]